MGTKHLDLLRALAVLAEVPAPEGEQVSWSVGLGPLPSREEHTEVLVLQCHPYASVHLGPEGMLGGEAGDRVAGFWRALDLVAPPEPDHLAALLGLYANLGEAESLEGDARRRAALGRARAALLWEHLLSWAPPLVIAVEGAGSEWYRSWANLLTRTLVEQALMQSPPGQLPLALRAAPPPLEPEPSLQDLVAALVAPVRSGLVLTRATLAAVGRTVGAGTRQGERRFMLQSLLSQQPARTIAALSSHAEDWARSYASWGPGLAGIAEWWADRAAHTGRVLASCGARPVR